MRRQSWSCSGFWQALLLSVFDVGLSLVAWMELTLRLEQQYSGSETCSLQMQLPIASAAVAFVEFVVLEFVHVGEAGQCQAFLVQESHYLADCLGAQHQVDARCLKHIEPVLGALVLVH